MAADALTKMASALLFEKMREAMMGNLPDLPAIVQEINDTLDVEGLCRAFPKRLQKLVDAKGDRIQH